MNKSIFVVVALVVVGGGSFYGGMKYNQSKTSVRGFGPGNRPQFAGATAATRNNIGGFINGEVLSKDATSITLKLRDGGSKIIFYSKDSMISKNATGTIGDVAVGSQLMVSGSANADGSLTAQTIQVRPTVPSVNFAPAATK